MSKYVIENLQKFNYNDENIYMYINSDGGDMDSGFAIIDQMELITPKIFTIVMGQALSMACVITMFGSYGYRFSTKSSFLMMHNTNLDIGLNDIYTHMIMSEFMKKDSDKKTDKILHKMCKNPKDIPIIKEKIKNNFWMNPEDAIKYNVIDRIWDKETYNKFKG